MARRLLLADDSITIQKVVELVLAEEDFDIKSVSNGEDALNLMETFHPDIVLADIEMPKINGYQLCERIKTNPRTASVPVILLAGAFEPIDNELSRKVGSDDSVIKPFESQELISKINAVLTLSAMSGMEAEAIAEPLDEALDQEEEFATAIQAEPAELAVEEDLWAMEDLTEVPDTFGAGALSKEGTFAAEAVAEVHIEMAPAEMPRHDEPAAIVAQAAEAVTLAPTQAPASAPVMAAGSLTREVPLPSKDEVMALIDRKVSEQVAAMFGSLHQTISQTICQKIDQRLDQELDMKDALLAAVTPMMKDSIEKILWEMAPELVEKVTKETVKGAFSSITAEVEKVLWETVPELAGTMISKEIEKIKASS
ncbi:MAG: response regulator [Thermodesulfovibrionales bacterium]